MTLRCALEKELLYDAIYHMRYGVMLQIDEVSQVTHTLTYGSGCMLETRNNFLHIPAEGTLDVHITSRIQALQHV